MVNKERLEKILDDQYRHCKSHIINDIQQNIQKLSDLRDDMVDIRTEIIIGHSMEETLFHEWYSDYYDKKAIISNKKENLK